MLGLVAAERLGVERLSADGRPLQVLIDSTWFTVAGVIGSLPLAPEIERAALIGYPLAKRLFATTRHASMLYVRADPERVPEADSLLGAAANPQNPEQTKVSRPSDALQARADAQSTLTAVFLGLGAVALLVGGVGIANVMVISVLERRPEIGLRRALGARAVHIGVQFLGESILLSLLGGLCRDRAGRRRNRRLRVDPGLDRRRTGAVRGWRGRDRARARCARRPVSGGARRAACTGGGAAQRLGALSVRAVGCRSPEEPIESGEDRTRLSGVAKTWILDTETKGTGAHIAPLNDGRPRPERELATVSFDRPPRPVVEPAPPAPRLFKVVDVMSARVLADGADTRETLKLLAGMRSVVDARIYVWAPGSDRWRLLSIAEQRALWQLRNREPIADDVAAAPETVVA